MQVSPPSPHTEYFLLYLFSILSMFRGNFVWKKEPPHSFISCNQCTDLVGDADDGDSYACLGARATEEISVSSS